MSVFGALYAETYDENYREKNYEEECDALERAFLQFRPGNVRRVLDLGCGTGNHTVPLANRGYEVVGVDRSTEMIVRAAAKPGAASVSFVEGDARTIRLDATFDAVLMLFAVLGYQTSNGDVGEALETARAHLEPDGLLVFDVWYGPAVLHERPSQRIRVVETARGRLLRVAESSLDINRHLCEVRYRLWELDDNRVVREADEQHAMRFFFPLELEAFLDHSGFMLERLGAFPDLDRDPDEQTWNVMAVARAR